MLSRKEGMPQGRMNSLAKDLEKMPQGLSGLALSPQIFPEFRKSA